MAIYIIPIIFLTGLIIENIKINQKYKNFISIVFILILLTQNFIKDNTSYLKSASYNIQDSFDFNEKFKEGQVKPKINGPSVLLNKDGTIKKISTRNDAFYFSYSPLMCYQSLFGYNLEKLNKKNIKFYSKRILSDGSILYYTDINKNKKEFTFFKPSCFLFPEENNCLPGDIFKSDEFENMVDFLNYEKIDFRQSKTQITSNYISIFSILFSLIYIIYFLINIIFKLRKKIVSF
tara:strand:+ start:114 stop:818 length:705 start_codon:yes stop_codon:yes gene_type:complete